MKFCPECGAKVEGMKFCPECGHSLSVNDTKSSKHLDPVSNSTAPLNPAEVQPQKKKKRGCLIAAIVFILLAAGGIGIAIMQNDWIQQSISGATSDDEYITLDEFNKIENGMTYEEVKKIVGSPGEVSSESGSGNYKVQIITWYGNGVAGSNANVTFMNGIVNGKAQVGLVTETSKETAETKKTSTKDTSANAQSNTQNTKAASSKSNYKKKIVGMWEGHWDDGIYISFDFMENGTFYCSKYDGSDEEDAFQSIYEVDGNKLILDTGETYTIKSIENDSLTLKTYLGTHTLQRMAI